MIHRGEILEKAVRKSGISISELARRLDFSRRHIYNLFANAAVNWDTMFEIGKIIQHDFSEDFDGYPVPYKRRDKQEIMHEGETEYETTDHWKNKYYELLEQYRELGEKYIVLLEKGKN